MKFAGEVLSAGGGGHAVVVPAALAAEFSRLNARVRALVNGTEYHSRIARYGGKSYLGLRRDLLKTIGVAAGDQVEIELTEEAEPEPAVVPEPTEPSELTLALAAEPAARSAFDALPPGHRREYLRWISEAKRSETRVERATKTVRRVSPPPR